MLYSMTLNGLYRQPYLISRSYDDECLWDEYEIGIGSDRMGGDDQLMLRVNGCLRICDDIS